MRSEKRYYWKFIVRSLLVVADCIQYTTRTSSLCVGYVLSKPSGNLFLGPRLHRLRVSDDSGDKIATCRRQEGSQDLQLSYVHVSSRMSKSLVNLCMFCIAKNLESIDRVGSFLCKNDNELVLELLCDHDMLTGNRMPYITTELLTSRLENIAFRYSGQVDDILLQKVALSRCKLKSFILKVCPQVSGEFRWHARRTSI